MRCPKCGYISFDYNQVCPKCNKDISSEQAKINVPPFGPDPPFLLGSLTGEADEPPLAMGIDDSSEHGADEPGDSIDENSVDFSGGASAAGDSESLGLKFDDEAEDDSLVITVKEEDALGGSSAENDANEFAFTVDEVESKPVSASAKPEDEEPQISFDFEDLQGEAPAPLMEVDAGADADAGTALGLDDFSLTPDSSSAQEEREGEIELNLEDLKINETGELEIRSESLKSENPLPDQSAHEKTVSLQAMNEEEGDIVFNLDDFSLDEESPNTQFDLGETKYEDEPVELEDLDLDLDFEKSDESSSKK